MWTEYRHKHKAAELFAGFMSQYSCCWIVELEPNWIKNKYIEWRTCRTCLSGQVRSQQYRRLYCVKQGKLWLIRIFQVAIFDLSNHNSHSSLLHQCWWGYFPTNSLSRRNMGLTLCNNIKHYFPPLLPLTLQSHAVGLKCSYRLRSCKYGEVREWHRT